MGREALVADAAPGATLPDAIVPNGIVPDGIVPDGIVPHATPADAVRENGLGPDRALAGAAGTGTCGDRPPRARVLVAFSSQGGSTAEIAQVIGITLLEQGCDVDVRPARQVESVAGFTGIVVGSGLYHGVWLPEAFKFLQRHRRPLASMPVWLFDSGPLDCSAEERLLPLTPGVASLARAIGARGHMTFGGKLGVTGLSLEERMLVLAGKAGDFRNFDDVREWAGRIADDLAREPEPVRAPPLARSTSAG